ncbi:hypothetical protein J437_LFUL017894 [Ladona fulva]|uniref:ARHGAP20 PH domain-containing protein n=1 Tax=Ladona fulva TaxID=123851 RepID=A0A8K0PC91_LADFU|nr:hypothetical protein J437_LFUL017894 [Ladona fulva]
MSPFFVSYTEGDGSATVLSSAHKGQRSTLEDLSQQFLAVLAKEEEETDLERIQDIFPNDALCLHEKDAHTMLVSSFQCVPLGTQKMKGLVRKRSIAASRIQRVLSSKPQRDVSSASSQTRSPTESPTHDRRHFIMESPVQFTTGVQSQDRHLFLFNDLLLVAKARSGGNFKLKDKVRVSDMWLSLDGIDELIEVTRSSDTSFVMGWPTTNIVATFSTKAARDQWFSKLTECKTFTIGPTDTAKHCIRIALEHLGVEGLNHTENIDEIIDDFQLWAKSGHRGDGDSPYPLMGHERPFAVKLHCLRQGLSTEEGFDLDHCNNLYGTDPFTRCQFLLSLRVGHGLHLQKPMKL